MVSMHNQLRLPLTIDSDLKLMIQNLPNKPPCEQLISKLKSNGNPMNI